MESCIAVLTYRREAQLRALLTSLEEHCPRHQVAVFEDCATYDGTQYELDVSAAWASLVQPNQTLSGGANVTSSNGYSVAASGTLNGYLWPSDAIYCCTNAGTSVITVLVTGKAGIA